MKSESQIKKRLERIRLNKAQCQRDGREEAYIINCKLEKLFQWVLE